MKSKELENRLKSLAYRVVKMCESLPKNKISGIIEGQILRSAFSTAANYRAACKAISRRAFTSKLSIAFEEADETLFWLEIIQDLKLISTKKLSLLMTESLEVSSILGAARKTLQTSEGKSTNTKS